MDILTTIQQEGLSIRQIPNIVYESYDIRNFKEGDEIVLKDLSSQYNYEPFKKKHSEREDLVFDDANQKIVRKICVRKRIPKNAGFWMCKKSTSTDSTMIWDIRTDNFAPTLEESINLFIKSNKKPNEK